MASTLASGTGTSNVSGYSQFSINSSSMYQSTLASSGLHKETLEDRLQQTKDWIYNAEEGTVMGRTPRDWGFVLAYFCVFLLCVIGVPAVMSVIYYWKILDWNHPNVGNASSILQTPGLGFRPQQHVNSRLVRYVKNDYTTYRHHLDHIEAYVQYYENELQQGEQFMDCNTIMERRPDNVLHKTCVFDMTNGLGKGNPCLKQQNYGYDDGQPCFLLKLNKIFNWIPEEYRNISEVPPVIRSKYNIYNPYNVYVHCEGDDAATRENMGVLSYHPNNGFPFKYFPFLNQQGFRSPLMFVRFENPNPGIMLMVTCKAYARNIVHDRVTEAGQISFQLMVD